MVSLYIAGLNEVQEGDYCTTPEGGIGSGVSFPKMFQFLC